MLNLITSQTDFEGLINGADWEDAYVRAVHFAAPSYQLLDGSTIDRCSLLVILIAVPMDQQVLEIVGFETELFLVFSQSAFDGPKTATIQRRLADADFGGVRLRCGCIGYRKLPSKAAAREFEFKEESLYDGHELAPPYNIDWRAALDVSNRSQ